MNYELLEFNVFYKNSILNNLYNISKKFKKFIERNHKILLINTMTMSQFINTLIHTLCILIDNRHKYNISIVEIINLLNYLKQHKKNEYNVNLIDIYKEILLINIEYKNYINSFYNNEEQYNNNELQMCQIIYECFDEPEHRTVDYISIEYIMSICPNIISKLLTKHIMDEYSYIIINILKRNLIDNDYSTFNITITHDSLIDIYLKVKNSGNKKYNVLSVLLYNKIFKNIITDSIKYNNGEYFEKIFNNNIELENNMKTNIIFYIGGLLNTDIEYLYMGMHKYLIYLLKNYNFDELQNYYNNMNYNFLDFIFLRRNNSTELLYKFTDELFKTLKNVEDIRLWKFVSKLYPNNKIKTLKNKFKIYDIVESISITYDVKIYLLFKMLKEHILKNKNILEHLNDGFLDILLKLNINLELIKFYDIFNKLYIYVKNKLQIRMNNIIKYSNNYICVNPIDREILLDIKNRLEENSTYLLYISHIEIIENISYIHQIMNLSNIDNDKLIIYHINNIEIKNKIELNIDNNEVCYLCLEKILTDLIEQPILKSCCNHYICENCSIQFFNIMPNLEILNKQVLCGLCRNSYNFNESMVYV